MKRALANNVFACRCSLSTGRVPVWDGPGGAFAFLFWPCHLYAHGLDSIFLYFWEAWRDVLGGAEHWALDILAIIAAGWLAGWLVGCVWCVIFWGVWRLFYGGLVRRRAGPKPGCSWLAQAEGEAPSGGNLVGSGGCEAGVSSTVFMLYTMYALFPLEIPLSDSSVGRMFLRTRCPVQQPGSAKPNRYCHHHHQQCERVGRQTTGSGRKVSGGNASVAAQRGTASIGGYTGDTVGYPRRPGKTNSSFCRGHVWLFQKDGGYKTRGPRWRRVAGSLILACIIFFRTGPSERPMMERVKWSCS